MSKFFEQYNAVLEKNLQKVRLKVDPLNKYAEDYGQYDGYVGYILAETENEIKFFYNNSTLNIPKKAVVIENMVANYLQGAAGQKPVGALGALGSITRGVAGTAARAVFGPQVTGTSAVPGSDTNNSTQKTPTTSKDRITMISQDMLGKSFRVVDSKGTASFTGSSNKTFYILKIQLLNKTRNVLENKSFRDIANFYTYLFENTNPPPIPPTNPPPIPPTNQPPQKAGIKFTDITSKPEFLNENALFTCMNIKDNSLVQGYGLLARVPNSNDFVINFSAQQS